jgi:amino acid permease
MSFKIKLKHNWNKIRLYLSFLLLAFYLTIAFLFLFSDIWADFIPKGRAVIGLILLLFGILRFYVAYRRYKNKNLTLKNSKEAMQNHTVETKQHATAE